MIKVGTLCWLVNLQPLDLSHFTGRVVEVVGPLAIRSCSSGTFASYIVDAPWLQEIRRMTGLGPIFIVAPYHLRPINDPDIVAEDSELYELSVSTSSAKP